MAKELIPILFTSIMWGAQLSRHHINFQCDNESLVIAINKGSSKDKLVMHLLRCLWFFAAHFDIQITTTHLPGALNVTADHLSRNNLTQAFLATPTLLQHPTSIPPPVFTLVSPKQLDWTSLKFFSLFQQTLLLI